MRGCPPTAGHPISVKKSDFDFDLPPELIAQAPLPERSASRLLHLQADGGREDRHVRDLPELLQAGDLLVFNDTRVIPARLFGHKESGGRVEILIERITGTHEARAQLGVSKSPKAGACITLDAGGEFEVLGREGEFYRLRLRGDEALEKLLLRAGRLPLPPYIQREPGTDDAERYQTVFARTDGAIAAPTAGLHFDQALLDAVLAAGAQVAAVTLWVGLGTFQPVASDRLSAHTMHAERYAIEGSVASRVRETRERGGRVVAVGTTVARALEDASRDTGHAEAGDRVTRLMIRPGFPWRCVDALFTNFHVPRSTLLALVASFGGYNAVMAAYRHAVDAGYRFYSYGDAMFLPRRHAED